MDAPTYIALGVGLAVVVWVAIYRREWLKYALAGFGVLVAVGAGRIMLERQRRLRDLGVGMETAGRIALLTSKAEDLHKAVATVEARAAQDKELRRVQQELEAELKTARTEGANVEAVREEIRRAFPGF